METLSKLRQQISSAEDLQSIVRSMKAMAAASIWQFEQAVATLEAYEHTIELGLKILLHAPEESIQVARPQPQQPLGAVVFGSEQGMVGNFNGEIVRYAVNYMENLDMQPEHRSLIAVGRRVHNRLEQANQSIALSMSMPTSIDSIRPTMQQLMVQLETWRERQNIDQILLFHNMPTSGTQFAPQAVQLVPIDPHWLQGLKQEPWPSASLPTFDLPWETLFSDLIQEYLYLALFRAFVASLSAENASRLAAMEAAETNIDDRLGDLRRRYHQARQRSITSELLDIIAGSKALGDTGN
jgi:F-type H+-transporting ATPase subunit gamma